MSVALTVILLTLNEEENLPQALESLRGWAGQVIVLDSGSVRSRTNKPDDGTRVVLFLSRIHPKKGIENLLQAWASLDTTGWVLRIAGPNEDGTVADGWCNALVLPVG